MRSPLHLVIGVLVAATAVVAAADVPPADVRTLITASAAARLGTGARIEVDLLRISDPAPAVSAIPLSGARLGAPARFTIVLADGRRATAVARVSAFAGHLVAARGLERDTELTKDAVAWVDGPLEGLLLEPLPAREDVIGARTRRAIAAGEVLTASMLRPADTVRANEPVRLVIRRGPVEVSGPGRAISSGRIGETIRVLRPGSRAPVRGRIVEPGVVEIAK